MKLNQQFIIRKTHRYLGVVIGIQFLLWTIGGLYFSWTEIDEIHGDHFRKEAKPPTTVAMTQVTNLADSTIEVHSLETRLISGRQYFWINGEKLIDSQAGVVKNGIIKEEAVTIVNEHILPEYIIEKVEYLKEVGPHHEYRGQALPAWVISYKGDDNLRAYISASDGKLQRVRYDSWRTFDFLWMLHIMDYNTRDDINNWILRGFSVLGILTILSGFLLFVYSSKSLRKRRKLIS